MLNEINIQETTNDDVSSFNKHLVKLFNRNRLSDGECCISSMICSGNLLIIAVKMNSSPQLIF